MQKRMKVGVRGYQYGLCRPWVFLGMGPKWLRQSFRRRHRRHHPWWHGVASRTSIGRVRLPRLLLLRYRSLWLLEFLNLGFLSLLGILDLLGMSICSSAFCFILATTENIIFPFPIWNGPLGHIWKDATGPLLRVDGPKCVQTCSNAGGRAIRAKNVVFLHVFICLSISPLM